MALASFGEELDLIRKLKEPGPLLLLEFDVLILLFWIDVHLEGLVVIMENQLWNETVYNCPEEFSELWTGVIVVAKLTRHSNRDTLGSEVAMVV